MGKGIIKGELPKDHRIIAAKLIFNGAPTFRFYSEVKKETESHLIFKTGMNTQPRFICTTISLN